MKIILIIIIISLFFICLIINRHNKNNKIKHRTEFTDEVEIVVNETWFSDASYQSYEAKFRRKGTKSWTYFLSARSGYTEIRHLTYDSPFSFRKFENYTYSQCLEHNNKEMRKIMNNREKREANRCVKIK